MITTGGTVGMSPVERRTILYNRLQADGKVNLNQIAAELNVSSMTIRRDLKLFVDQGIVTISAGTAHLIDGSSSVTLVRSEGEPIVQDTQKQAIGRAAADHVEDGDTIIVDCGTTTLQLLRYLGNKSVTIITNSIPVAGIVGNNPNVKIIYAPGEYTADSNGIVGPLTVDFFHTLRADKAFIGAHGFDAQGGVNEPVLGDATAKRAMLDSARESYLMADSSKYGNVHLMALSRLSDFSCVITDSDFPAEKRGELEAACKEVIYA